MGNPSRGKARLWKSLMEYGRFGLTNLVIVVSFAVSFKDGGFISDSVPSSVRVRACCWTPWKICLALSLSTSSCC